MPIETDFHRTIYFDSRYHAEAAQWSPGHVWDPVSVQVIMQRSSEGTLGLGSVELTGEQPRATLKASALPAWAGRGDRLVVTATGEDFEVVQPLRHDDTRQIVTAYLRDWSLRSA
jgi:hypothetical protein